MRPAPRLAFSRIEALEPRIAPSAVVLVNPSTATYTDPAGETFTVKFSKPILTADNVDSILTVGGQGGEVVTIHMSAVVKASKSNDTSLDIETVPKNSSMTIAIIGAVTIGSGDVSALTVTDLPNGWNLPVNTNGPGGTIDFTFTNEPWLTAVITGNIPTPTLGTIALSEPPVPKTGGFSGVVFLAPGVGASGSLLGDVSISEVKIDSTPLELGAAGPLQLRPDFSAATAGGATGIELAKTSPGASSKAAIANAVLPRAAASSPAGDTFLGIDRITISSMPEIRLDVAVAPSTSVAPLLIGDSLLGGYEPNPVSAVSDRNLFDVSFLGSLLGGLEED